MTNAEIAQEIEHQRFTGTEGLGKSVLCEAAGVFERAFRTALGKTSRARLVRYAALALALEAMKLYQRTTCGPAPAESKWLAA